METNSGIFFSFREREIFLLWINMDLNVIWWSFREREIDSYCNFVTLIKILCKVFWKFSLIHVKCKTIYVRDRIQIVSSIDAFYFYFENWIGAKCIHNWKTSIVFITEEEDHSRKRIKKLIKINPFNKIFKYFKRFST